MAARWLVALAVLLVSRPIGATGAGFQVERAQRRVTTAASVTPAAPVTLAGEVLAIVERAQIRAGDVVALLARPRGDLLVKTRTHLVAIDRATGDVRWAQPTTTLAAPIIDARGEIVDTWIDRETHTFGLVSRDPIDGRTTSSIELGSTRGWYDVHNVVIAPDGPGEVLVSAMFGVI